MPHLLQRRGDLLLVERVDRRLIILRHDMLAEHHRDPAGVAEQLEALAEDAALGAEQVDLALQAVRDLHRPAMVPERRRRAWSPCSGG